MKELVTCTALVLGLVAGGCTGGTSSAELPASVRSRADVAADVVADLRTNGVPEDGSTRDCPLAIRPPAAATDGEDAWTTSSELVQCQWGAQDGYYLLAASRPSLSGAEVDDAFRSRAASREGVERTELGDGRVVFVSSTDFSYREGTGQVLEIFGPEGGWYVRLDAPTNSDWLSGAG